MTEIDLQLQIADTDGFFDRRPEPTRPKQPNSENNSFYLDSSIHLAGDEGMGDQRVWELEEAVYVSLKPHQE